MNLDMGSLIFSVIFGALGTGYFIYGKRQGKAMPMLVGIALSIFPFFISGAWSMCLVGIALSALPFVLKF